MIPLVTADQLLAHLVGDYILQSDWAAVEKKKRWLPALHHAFFYTLPFLLFTRSWVALGVILVSHAIIDHYGLARYVSWAKNWNMPWWELTTRYDPKAGTSYWKGNRPWAACSATGYDPDRPLFLTLWLLFIVDNILHILINGLAIKYL